MGDCEEVDSANIMRILVATDNHLGYAEKDPVRGEDSFRAFEEILQLAVAENVDFILLGGDLFHDAVPSQNSLQKCMKLLRQYTFGDKPISIEFLNNEAHSFHNALNETVNYEDPNLNISIPVFSIHGNHDDPSGFGRLSSLDLLSTSGLVNYFGRWTDLTKVDIKPLMLRKGETQLALYGLSHIHDARLARLFENCKVTIECPSAEEGEWFHLMVLHQNRADRGPKNYVPEEILPEFMHLIIWGHEHDCRIEPERNSKKDFYVSQPGSSVPTSLAEGEALKKHVGLLEIYKNKFQMKPLPLQTVRPFVFESLNLSDYVQELGLDEGDPANKVKSFLTVRMEAMIERSKDLLTGHPEQPTMPLIRLRVLFTEEDFMFNAIRFGQMFSSKVANPSDVLHFKKIIKRVKRNSVEFDKEAIKSAFEKMEIETTTRVEHLLDRYFEEVTDNKALQLLNSAVVSEMCYRLVDRKDNIAAENIIKYCKKEAVGHLMDKLPSGEDINENLITLKQRITADTITKIVDNGNFSNATLSDVSKPESNTSVRGRRAVVEEESKPTTGRGRGRGRGSRGRGSSTTTISSRTHQMPKLDVSVGSVKSSTKQKPTLLDAIERQTPRRKVKPVTYVVLDDSDD